MTALLVESPDLLDRIEAFVVASQTGTLTPAQLAQFEQLLHQSREAQRLYAEFVKMVVYLPRALSTTGAGGNHNAPAAAIDSTIAPAASPPLAFLSHVFHGTLGYCSSGWPVAYLLATVIFGMGLLIGSMVHVSQPEQVAKQLILPSIFGRGAGGEGIESLTRLRPTVGRITGMVDCQFDRPKSQDPRPKPPVSLGDKIALTAGLMEITYDTGAKVILQGPVTYEVESKDGGYLSVGKLTARVETANPQASSPKSQAPSPKSDDIHPSSLIPHPLFSVRTPTATVTDLGTEFGVCVDQSGSTDTDVFHGTVEVRTTPAENGTENVVRLTENQSAHVRMNEDRVVTVSPSKARPEAFVCRMPQPLRRMAVKVYNTGAGLKEGDPDPHWQIVAASNDPKFQPRAAIVTSSRPGGWLDNETGRSQWISLDAGTVASNGVTYTFRTSFDLAGASPETAVLNGWFAVDNHVRAIRINGNGVSVPQHAYDKSYSRYYRFAARSGFVAGPNTLEIEVENGTPEAREPLSPMGVRVDLEATARYKQAKKNP